MARVVINGISYSGMNVSISNNRVFVDGKEVSVDKDAREIRIQVDGDLASLDVDACDRVDVKGNVTGDISVSAGNVRCGNVEGDVTSTAGNIDCGNVGGSVRTMAGDISHKR